VAGRPTALLWRRRCDPMQSKGGVAYVQNPARTTELLLRGRGAVSACASSTAPPVRGSEREEGSATPQPKRRLLLRERCHRDEVLMGMWVEPSGSFQKQTPFRTVHVCGLSFR
jgi:hypothetical protein